MNLYFSAWIYGLGVLERKFCNGESVVSLGSKSFVVVIRGKRRDNWIVCLSQSVVGVWWFRCKVSETETGLLKTTPSLESLCDSAQNIH